MSEYLLKQKLADCEKALTAAERERDELKAALKVHEDELAGAASGATKALILKLTKERDSLAAKCEQALAKAKELT